MIEAFGLQLGTVFQGGTFVACLGVFGLILRSYIVGMPERAKVAFDREANLLEERAEEMVSMRGRLALIEGKLAEKDRLLETERTIYRHRIANLNQAFTALLMLLRKGVPVEEAVAEVERMRAEQLDREIAEATMFRAAGLMIDVPDLQKSDVDSPLSDTISTTQGKKP